MLELIPGTALTPIQVRLVHKSLSQMPQVLKRLRKFQGFAPDHNPDSNRLKITERTLFWIDAICINQDDLDERSQQVLLMGSIYKNASRVTVWLGEEVARSQEVWDLMAPLGDQVDKFKINVNEKNKEEYGSTMVVCPGLCSRTFPSTLLLLTSWTPFPLEHYSCVFGQSKRHASRTVLRRQIQENAPLSQEDFFDMLLASTFVHASDERDRVFGVLGLFGEDTRAPFSNLGYPNESEEIFRAATEAIVNTGDKGLDFLIYNHAAVISGDTLSARGLVFDTVTIAYPNFSLKKVLFRLVFGTPTSAFDPVEQYEGWMCRILLREWERSTSKDESSDTWRGILLSTLRARAALRFEHLDRRVQDDTIRRDHNDQLTGEGHNIFATSKGYFGIGAYGKNNPGSPSAVQVNDKIAIIPGVKQPLVLRPCENAEYKFVGPSLIPEVEMDESVQVENRKPIELIRIV
ncbi:uncharacterized protein EAF02_009383 [Botrytis sinoallii]|uniref:uncharacterized protein n=1 Tax=Botrytis sinoallii TaxID=1463999 RepID=UPI0019009399|nr:uncharacterized protein EAF02_009383 [Botrytis sinoallii]KAF7870193.1 hypothetical protein EAF02_009383 [Botrytis sinoallii]